MQDEHSGEGQQPAAGQPGMGQYPPPPPPPPAFGQQSQRGGSQSQGQGQDQPQGQGQQGDYGYGYGQPSSQTQPIGYGPAGSYMPAGGYGQAGGYGGFGGYGGYQQPGGYGYGYGPPPRRRRAANAVIYLLVAAIAAAAGAFVVTLSDSHSTPSASTGSGSGSAGNGFPYQSPYSGSGGTNSGSSVSGATEQKVEDAVEPGLVVISSNLQYQGDAAAATGMIISRSGLVLTNNHVIDGTTGLTATVIATGQRYKAQWLGYDKKADIAVIQLEGASGLRTVPIGNSNSVKVGNGAVAMGNANGTGNITTVTGSITGLDRSITASDDGDGQSENLTGMIQTNSEIVPGDSGGPLANTSGQVIGMDTAASTDTLGSSQQDVGFAIPINRAMTIARQIIDGQSSSVVKVGSAGFLGVLVTSGPNGAQSTETNPRSQLQQQVQNSQQGGYGNQQYPGPSSGCLSNDENAGVPSSVAPVDSGTLVLGALCGTPASTAGLGSGDVITSVDGHAVSSPSSLVGILAGLHSGQSVSVTWVTPSDHTMSQSMTLAAAPPQ
jgi:S1-C subfamily serine protease